ncbi:MAG TPA: STAS domain-containing protein [Pyrinomonadaceae bacterium]|nr:STAS domain-containing protein [Pyrinomonadaceae bacterium]
MISERESLPDVGNEAVVFAGDYLNKLAGEQIERECQLKLLDGCSRLIVNFSRTELVNSIGISILLGVIDSAENAGTELIFSDVKEDTVELFETLGITRHVTIQN